MNFLFFSFAHPSPNFSVCSFAINVNVKPTLQAQVRVIRYRCTTLKLLYAAGVYTCAATYEGSFDLFYRSFSVHIKRKRRRCSVQCWIPASDDELERFLCSFESDGRHPAGKLNCVASSLVVFHSPFDRSDSSQRATVEPVTRPVQSPADPYRCTVRPTSPLSSSLAQLRVRPSGAISHSPHENCFLIRRVLLSHDRTVCGRIQAYRCYCPIDGDGWLHGERLSRLRYQTELLSLCRHLLIANSATWRPLRLL